MIKFIYDEFSGALHVFDVDGSAKEDISIKRGKESVSWDALKEMIGLLCGLYLDERDLTDVEYSVSIKIN